MSMSVGASSNALSYLQQLVQQGAAGASGAANAGDPLSTLLQSLAGSGAPTDSSTTATTPGTGSSGCSSFDAGTMAALISLQGQPATGIGAQSPSPLFAKLDTDGDGQISQSEFETALGCDGVDKSSADALFAKLDANGDGSISQSELASAKRGHGHHRHHAGGQSQAGASSGQNPLDSLLSSAGADGATTQTSTNPDGSTTTTISYSDGSSVEMTSPAAPAGGSDSDSAGNGATGQNSANLLEQLIRLQAQLLSAAAPALSAFV